MTIGQRIAQGRKTCNLSQEALGEQLGVSRQSIYKWESDTALPEIDKLIALSRLFGCSVGQLLGVEDAATADIPPEDGPLTETQLALVEEIVGRYLAALPTPKPRRRWPFVAAALVLAAVSINLFNRLDHMDQQYQSLENSVGRVTQSVDRQIGSIAGRVEEILKSQNNLTAEYGTEISSGDLAGNHVTFLAYAVPKTHVNGMTVEFFADCGDGNTVPAVLAQQEGQRFSASISCPLTDDISLSVVFVNPDGTRETQLLDRYDGLYSASLPETDLMTYGHLLNLEADQQGRIAIPETYITTRHSSSIYADNEALGRTEIDSLRIGLFQNQQLVQWLEPCEQPENFHGDFTGKDFFRLPELTVTMTGTDTLAFAAILRDTHGREAVYSDIPYVLTPQGEITWVDAADLSSHDPGEWVYS